MPLSKQSKELLRTMNGNEIRSSHYETVVGLRGNKVISAGEVIDTLNTNRKVNRLWKEYIFNEYGTTDLKTILRREGF